MIESIYDLDALLREKWENERRVEPLVVTGDPDAIAHVLDLLKPYRQQHAKPAPVSLRWGTIERLTSDSRYPPGTLLLMEKSDYERMEDA